MTTPLLTLSLVACAIAAPCWFFRLSHGRRARVFHLVVLPLLSIGALATMTLEQLPYLIVMHLVQFSGMAVCLHRFFSHRAFKSSRWFTFVLGVWGSLAIQGGPMFWAAHHREHHRACDRPGEDLHTPHPELTLKSFWRSHLGWFHEDGAWSRERYRLVPDLARRPELWLLDPAVVGATLWFGLAYLALGWQGVLLAGLSTMTSNHASALVNSVCHVAGERRLKMPRALSSCMAGNVWWTLPLQLGENWHRNHHRYGYSATTKLEPHQLDPMFWLIRAMEALGLIWDVRIARGPGRSSTRAS